jgi:hypothetical protein
MRSNAVRVARTLIVLAAAASLIGCGRKADKNDEPAQLAEIRESALVRFVNATNYREPVDVYRDEAKVLPAVGKDKITDYSEWLAERHDIELRAPGNSKPIAMKSDNLGAGQRYTVVGFNKIDGTSGVGVFRDNISKPELGKARIRLIHIADGADDLDVYPTGAKTAILDDVDYNTDESAEVNPAISSLEIRKKGEKVVAIKIPSLSLQAGNTYTIIVAADQDHKLRAIQIADGVPADHSHLK